MKKILFAVLLFMTTMQVFAMERNAVNYEQDFINICDSDGNVYPIYKLQYLTQPMYFLNLSNNYNLNFEDYHEISFSDSPYPKEIMEYSGTDLYGDEYFNLGIYSLLWERLYPEKEFQLCQKNSESNQKIQSVKDMVNIVVNGPLSEEKIILAEKEKYVYQNPYYGYFELLSAGGLDISDINSIISFSAPKGIYEIVYQRKQAGFDNGPSLYTDGENYLLVNTKITSKVFKYQVIVGYKQLNIKVVDKNQNVLPDMCFNIEDNNYCSDSNGNITAYLDDDKYWISGCNEGYEDYEKEVEVNDDLNLEITLNKKQEDIPTIEPEIPEDRNEATIEIPDVPLPEITEEKVPIKLPDTFTISASIITLFLGILLVKIKVK